MMEQTKALNALEPFLALSKSATSPRAAADLVTRATSAPNTYIFAELLQTPQIQALYSSPEFASHLTLLQVFSYGTYKEYHATPNLPVLSETQTLKLRQLSLLSLARARSNLSYDALQEALGLSSARQVEGIVRTAVYAGLIRATLDPARHTVQVASGAPLRDLCPGSIPDMITALKNWSDRCQSTLGDLDEQVSAIRAAAAVRENEKRTAEEKVQKLLGELRDTDKKTDITVTHRDLLAKRGISTKRTMADSGGQSNADSMDVDEPLAAEEKLKRVGKRKM